MSYKHYAIFDVNQAQSVLTSFFEQIGAWSDGTDLPKTITNFTAKWELLFDELDLNFDGNVERDELSTCSLACHQLIESHPLAAPIAGIFNQILLCLIELAEYKGPVSKEHFRDAMQFVIDERLAAAKGLVSNNDRLSDTGASDTGASDTGGGGGHSKAFGTNEEEFDEEESENDGEEDEESEESESSSSESSDDDIDDEDYKKAKQKAKTAAKGGNVEEDQAQ